MEHFVYVWIAKPYSFDPLRIVTENILTHKYSNWPEWNVGVSMNEHI